MDEETEAQAKRAIALTKHAIRAGYETAMQYWDGYYTPRRSEYEAFINAEVEKIFEEITKELE